MLQSQLFTKTSKELPKDENSFNAQILIRAGFIDKLGAGIYNFLPLGLRVLNKITNIIREEINALGGQEILMPALIPKDNWEATGRWATFDALFRLKGVDEKEYALGATHEEVVTPLAKRFILSYKDLPFAVYQIQTKYRNELRAKAGLLRGREFSMKDLYSFHADEKDLDSYYEKAKEAYFKIFSRCGLRENTFLTFSSGGSFSEFSHEFQTVIENGEDTIYLCPKCRVAVNKEIIKRQKNCPECGADNFQEKKAIEVGNIFKLGARFSRSFNLQYTNAAGQKREVIMGCYGLGPSRIMGAIVETRHDDRGLIWPEEVAPFKAHLIGIMDSGSKLKKEADKIHQALQRSGVETLYDDRENTAGEKFIDADLIGCPYRLVVSGRTLEKGSVELKERGKAEMEMIKIENLVEFFRQARGLPARGKTKKL